MKQLLFILSFAICMMGFESCDPPQHKWAITDAYEQGWIDGAANVAKQYDSINHFAPLDYGIILHNDTVWLYNQIGELVKRGDYDSLLLFIEQDNL